MDRITTLPTELLLQIFELDAPLTLGDLTRVKRVCKRFHDVAHQVFQNFTLDFVVDSVDHSAWKLGRSLLANPKRVGEQFSKIKVVWKRRDVGDPATWTTAWLWTPEEAEQIRQISREWKLYPGTGEAAVLGINSEALLPIILCFTWNLESLELGNIEARTLHVFLNATLEDGRPFPFREALNEMCETVRSPVLKKSADGVLERGLGSIWRAGDRVFIMDGLQENENDPDIDPNTPNGAWGCRLWFHANIPHNLPGLINLKSIQQGFLSSYGGHHGLPLFQDFFPVFFLPNIESIRAENFFFLSAHTLSSALESYHAGESPVKELIMEGIHFLHSELKHLAIITGSLERVRFLYQGHEYRNREERTDGIEDVYLKHNPNLRRENICIKL